MLYYLLHHRYRSFWNLEAFSGTFQIKMMGTSNVPELVQCFCNLKQSQSFVCKTRKLKMLVKTVSEIRAILKISQRHMIWFLNSHYIFELHLSYRLLQRVVTDCILFIQRHLIPRHNFNFLFMIRCCHLQLNKRQQNILLTRGFFATDFVVYTSQWGTKIIIHSFYFLKTAFLDFSRSCEVPSARPELFKALLNRDWKWPHLIKCKNIKKS